MLENNTHGDGKMDNKLIDLNARPQRVHGQTSNNQVFIFQCLGWSLVFYFFAFKHWPAFMLVEQSMDVHSGTNHESESVVPVGSFKREPEK